MADLWSAIDIRDGKNEYIDTSEDEEGSEFDTDAEAETAVAATSSEPRHGSFLDRILRFVPQFQIPYDQATYTVDALCGWENPDTGEWIDGIALTGDIILMAGDDASSNAVRLFTPSVWSHVAIVVKQGHEVYLLESVRVIDRVPSYRADNVREFSNGVRVVRLRDKMEHYHGHAIAIRHLAYINLETQRTLEAHLNNVVHEMQRLYLGMPYDSQPLDFINIKLWFWTKQREETDPCKKYKHGLFCSSLVAEFFLMAGMVPKHLCQEATCFSPESFSDTGEFYPVFPTRLLERKDGTGPRILEQLGSLAGYQTGQLITYTPELMVQLPNAVETPVQRLRMWWRGKRGAASPPQHLPATSRSVNKSD